MDNINSVKKLSVEEIQKFLDTNSHGLLYEGSHLKNAGYCCALECINAMRFNSWSDDPWTAGIPDLRTTNDGPWASDEQRTKYMIPLLSALSTWKSWTENTKASWTKQIAARMFEIPRRRTNENIILACQILQEVTEQMAP